MCICINSYSHIVSHTFGDARTQHSIFCFCTFMPTTCTLDLGLREIWTAFIDLAWNDFQSLSSFPPRVMGVSTLLQKRLYEWIHARMLAAQIDLKTVSYQVDEAWVHSTGIHLYICIYMCMLFLYMCTYEAWQVLPSNLAREGNSWYHTKSSKWIHFIRSQPSVLWRSSFASAFKRWFIRSVVWKRPYRI